MANIKDISRLSGCSKSTVSRFLNNGSVSEKTAQKIQRVIEELNYAPNAFAQSLKANRSFTIGTIVPNFIGFSKNLTLTAIDHVLKNNLYKLFISNSGDDVDQELKIIQNMANQKLDGIILFASNLTHMHYEIIKSIEIPVVLIGQSLKDVHCVVHDDFKAGRLIGEYLLSMNHKNVAYFGVGKYDKSVKKRYEGILDAVHSHGINVVYHEVDFKAQTAYQKIKQIYDHNISYYIGATDNIAYGIMRGLHELGLKIPTDVSVSGFGDYDMNLYVNPKLSTIHFSYYEAGVNAAELLLKLIEEEKMPTTTLLDCHLEVRESTGRLEVV